MVKNQQEIILFLQNGNEIHGLGAGFFVQKRIISAVQRVKTVGDRMTHIILGSRWCDIIVLNEHAPTEDKTDDMKASCYEQLEYVFDKFQKCHTKILLGDFNAKVVREDIFKPTIWSESLHRISNDNGGRPINYITSKNIIVKVQCSHLDISRWKDT
jgi:hypothetical protein